MGWAARAKRESPAAPARRAVAWRTCKVCGTEYPTFATSSASVSPLDVCDRCMYADLSRVSRECPERFRFLPTFRVAQDLPVVAEVASNYRCDADCPACSGERCMTHAAGCDCDVIDRHESADGTTYVGRPEGMVAYREW